MGLEVEVLWWWCSPPSAPETWHPQPHSHSFPPPQHSCWLQVSSLFHPMAEALARSQCHRWMCKEALSLSNPFGKLFSRTEDGVGVESAEGCELRRWQPGRMGVKAGLLGSELI